jgi:hypothetical protein
MKTDSRPTTSKTKEASNLVGGVDENRPAAIRISYPSLAFERSNTLHSI